MEPLDNPLRIVVVEIEEWDDSLERVSEAASLYKKGLVDKIFIFGRGDEHILKAHSLMRRRKIPLEDVSFDEIDLPSFIRGNKEGVRLVIVIVPLVRYIREWYKHKKYPGWVWIPIEFHIVGVF